MKDRIVVGVDGSAPSLAALHWAAEEARLRRLGLYVVTTWTFPYGTALPGVALPSGLEDDLRREAKSTQAEAIARVIPDDGRLTVEAEVLEGAPAATLIEAGRDAAMLVVGSRGLGGFRELLLGSVSQQCAHHASCPVVVVRS